MKTIKRKRLILVTIIIMIGIALTIFCKNIKQNRIEESNKTQNKIEENNNLIDKNKIEEINSIVNSFEPIKFEETHSQELNELFLGKEVKEYLETFELTEVSVNVSKNINNLGMEIVIIPAPDFLNNQYFYYNNEGKLIFYKNESVGVGGSIIYYFNNERLIKKENKIEENIEVEFEDESDILFKAYNLYDRYINFEF